jgi:protein-disulfide isomerase
MSVARHPFPIFCALALGACGGRTAVDGATWGDGVVTRNDASAEGGRFASTSMIAPATGETDGGLSSSSASPDDASPPTIRVDAADAGSSRPLFKVPLGPSPVRGPGDAWVTMVEFGDYECPYCGAEEPIVRALLQAYPTQLRLVFKNFPLTSIHPYAQGAAIAAECAQAQGLFWPMHDLLLQNQTALESQNLPTYAAQAGLDMTTWQACLMTAAPAQAVAADVTLGTTLGVSGTPTFFINGQEVVGAVPIAQLQAVIEAQLAIAEASGVPAAQYYDAVVLGP